MYLQGKKILFIGPEFYDYHNKIINEMILNGAEVDYFPEILNTINYRFAKLYFFRYRKWLEKRYLENIFISLKENYDYFFLIRGEIISNDFLEKLKTKIPQAKFIMYQWDSSQNNPNYLKIISYFSKVMTFDRVDAKEQGIKYLPLFYTKEYETLKLNLKREYDIVFFGAYHSDRLQIIKELHKECLKLGLKCYFVIYITKMAFLVRILNGTLSVKDYKYMTFHPLNKRMILNTYANTKAVLDIENVGQNGLTMRTFEVLGASLQLITTNSSIKYEPFYDDKQILLLPRGNKKKMDLAFFYQDYSLHNLLKEYRLSEWLKKIFI